MKNFLKGMLFSLVTVIMFFAVMLFAFDVRDKKYFKDLGTVAEEKESYNFFYGVFGYHNLDPVYKIETDDFDFNIYEIVTNKKSDPNELLEYYYLLYIPKTSERKNDKNKYIRLYDDKNKYEAISLYQYMNFNMYNAYDDNFLIEKKYFLKDKIKDISIVEEVLDDKGKTESTETIYRETFNIDRDNTVMRDKISSYIEVNGNMPGVELIDEGIYPRITHIAEGYGYILWIGFAVGMFVSLALFGGVYLKPPFQKGTVEPSRAMKEDKEKYL